MTKGASRIDPEEFKNDSLVQVWMDSRVLATMSNWLMEEESIDCRFLSEVVRDSVQQLCMLLVENGRVEFVEDTNEAKGLLYQKFRTKFNRGGRGKKNLLNNQLLSENVHRQKIKTLDNDVAMAKEMIKRQRGESEQKYGVSVKSEEQAEFDIKSSVIKCVQKYLEDYKNILESKGFEGGEFDRMVQKEYSRLKRTYLMQNTIYDEKLLGDVRKELLNLIEGDNEDDVRVDSSITNDAGDDRSVDADYSRDDVVSGNDDGGVYSQSDKVVVRKEGEEREEPTGFEGVSEDEGKGKGKGKGKFIDGL